MRDVTHDNFGLLIAYVIPGVLVVWGVSGLSPTVAAWLGSLPDDAPTVGGFLFVTIASVAAGMTASTLRWAIIDSLHHLTGVRPPRWNFRQLRDNVAAYQTLLEIHYRYYQFYGNTVIALVAVFGLRRMAGTTADGGILIETSGTGLLIVLFFFGSRDALRKFYSRCGQLFGDPTSRASVNRVRRTEEIPPG